MLNLKIGNKDYNVAFAYEPTLKTRLLSRLARKTTEMEGGEVESIEDMLLFVPEILLVGLQRYHEEFRYDYDSKNGYEEKLNMAFALVGEYIDDGENDAIELSNLLQEELMKNGFLKKMFDEEMGKAQKAANRKK